MTGAFAQNWLFARARKLSLVPGDTLHMPDLPGVVDADEEAQLLLVWWTASNTACRTSDVRPDICEKSSLREVTSAAHVRDGRAAHSASHSG